MAKSSCRYNGNTNCDRTKLHTWISTLAWQRALRVKHLQLSMLTQAECHWQHGLAHQDQYRQRHVEENCSVLLPTLVSGSTLLSCDHPNHVSRNQHWNGPHLDFNALFYLTRAGLLQKIGQYQKPKSTIANSTVLSKVVLSELPLVDQLWSLQIHLCMVIPAHKYLNL